VVIENLAKLLFNVDLLCYNNSYMLKKTFILLTFVLAAIASTVGSVVQAEILPQNTLTISPEGKPNPPRDLQRKIGGQKVTFINVKYSIPTYVQQETLRITNQTYGLRRDGTYVAFPKSSQDFQYSYDATDSTANNYVEKWFTIYRYCTEDHYVACAVMVEGSRVNYLQPPIQYIGYYRPQPKI